ncbi:MAG: tRNA methyltransferase, partial [Thermoproteota archaeon]
IIRTIEAREGKTRHSFQGIGHTTYLCYARKAFFGRGSRKKPDASSDETYIPSDVESDTKSI